MSRAWLALVAVASLATHASFAHAQPPPVGDEFGAPPPASAPPGAAQGAQETAPDAPDPEADPDVSFALAFAIGIATQEQFDRVLGALGYEESGAVFGGDAAVLLPLASWLWLGGRAVLRSRNWARSGDAPAHAFGVGLLVTLEARAAVGNVLGFAFGAGAGGGPLSMRLGEAVESPLAPAASGYVRITTRVGEGAHLFGRFEYAFFEAANLRDTQLDVNLNGVTFGFGMEVRR